LGGACRRGGRSGGGRIGSGNGWISPGAGYGLEMAARPRECHGASLCACEIWGLLGVGVDLSWCLRGRRGYGEQGDGQGSAAGDASNCHALPFLSKLATTVHGLVTRGNGRSSRP
jgi:hypothetical protein